MVCRGYQTTNHIIDALLFSILELRRHEGLPVEIFRPGFIYVVVW